MTVLFEYPKKAEYGRVLPKSKIYEYAGTGAALKDLFVREVDQIVWKFKLAPETINVPATATVPEIQVFFVSLKTPELKEDILHCIDKAIPFPIVFELSRPKGRKAVAAYKRPNEADSSKRVVSSYFETGWLDDAAPRRALPIALDLGGLYEELLAPLVPCAPRTGETFPARVERAELICARRHEIARTEARLAREKQFNRKVEINAEIRAMKQQLEELVGPVTGGKK